MPQEHLKLFIIIIYLLFKIYNEFISNEFIIPSYRMSMYHWIVEHGPSLTCALGMNTVV